MKIKIKKILIFFIKKIFFALGRFRRAGIINGAILEQILDNSQKVQHNGISMFFSVPNELNYFRVNTFSSKEPETLDWIDTLKPGTVLWDIGANIGLYSVYAAKRGLEVVSFEPSVFNLELLARNINLNHLEKEITIFSYPISEKNGLNTMKFSSKQMGGALSSFGETFGWDGKEFENNFSYQTLGFKLDDINSKFNLKIPNNIKIDVDGIEHLILKGGIKTLSNIDSILIEVNDNFLDQAKNCQNILEKSGFKLITKLNSQLFKNSNEGYDKVYNQIWKR
jgi:FkbM family methyltransferase